MEEWRCRGVEVQRSGGAEEWGCRGVGVQRSGGAEECLAGAACKRKDWLLYKKLNAYAK